MKERTKFLDNPWIHLPSKSPYVLETDKKVVEIFNRKCNANNQIHTELLPEPFLGDPIAPIVVLQLNPGFNKIDRKFNKQKEFHLRLLQSIQQVNGNQKHFYLSESTDSGGGKWWSIFTKSLVQKFDRLTVARNIFAIEFFPYHSFSFNHAHLRLPSQDFSFKLVREAIKRHAVIVLCRGENFWFGTVPELADYKKLCYVRNPRKTTLSEINLGKKGFSLVCNALNISGKKLKN